MATRELLLDAAEREFSQRGATRTSLAEVASAAGVTRGAVYWHFRDKSDLFAAMCARAKLPMETTLERAATTPQTDPLGTLLMLMTTALTNLASDRRAQAVFEVLFHKCELTGELAPLAQRRQRERSLCLNYVERVLQQAVEAGQLPADTDTALATHALHAYMGGLMRDWVADKHAYDLATVAPMLAAMAIAGLRADPPRRSQERGQAQISL